MRVAYFFILALLLSSCKLFRKTAEEDPELAWRKTLSQTQAERVAFQTMSLSGKVRVSSPSGDFSGISASYRIDMRQDSAMLIRLSKFIEVARILIDQDSIRVLDRLGGTYRVCDFSLAEEYTGLKADYQVLQDLILGNFYPIPTQLVAENVQSSPQSFKGTSAGTEFRYFIDPLILKLVQIEANNPLRNLSSVITYDDFETTGGTSMPRQITIEASSPEQAEIELSHRRVDLNPSRVSFDLGDVGNYQREGCDL